MSWDSIGAALLILLCTGSGMFLGAWIAVRGFEKSLVATMNDPNAPWNKDDSE